MAVGRPAHARSSLQAIAVVLAAMLSACGPDNRFVAPPPPQVTVALPRQQKVTRYLEVNGNTSAVNTANLVARVQGFLQQINYSDGDLVKEGATLFTIEPELLPAQARTGAGGSKPRLRRR